MTPEAKVKASVVKILKDYGVYYFFPATHGFGRSGVPDIICCFMVIISRPHCKSVRWQISGEQAESPS
jgi:hypothetical protein